MGTFEKQGLASKSNHGYTGLHFLNAQPPQAMYAPAWRRKEPQRKAANLGGSFSPTGDQALYGSLTRPPWGPTQPRISTLAKTTV